VPDPRTLPDVELSTPRLLLRPWRPADADAAFDAMQDRRMHEFLNLPDPYTREDASTFVTEVANAGRAAGTGLGCAVVERSTERVVGSADLRFSSTNLLGADIGYAVYPHAQGHGYAAEATRALTTWGHRHGLNRIELRCAVTNLASAATALAAGFAFEGVHRAQLAIPGSEIEAASFARLADDSGEPIRPAFPRLGTLEDGVLRVRAVRPQDAQPYWEQEVDEASVAFGLREAARSLAEVSAMTRRAGLNWLVGPGATAAIIDAATGAFAGSVQLSMAGPPGVARVGYTVHPAFRGRGYAARAVRLLAPWTFDVAGLNRLELGAKVENVASQRVAISAGFTPDGVRAARLRNPDGTFSDEARFALINPQTARRIRP
jgi:RimJ/RimL family protein N-acetyltransferase